jgi:hypothetical protein
LTGATCAIGGPRDYSTHQTYAAAERAVYPTHAPNPTWNSIVICDGMIAQVLSPE